MLVIPSTVDDYIALLSEGVDETSFAHQGVPGTKWGVRKWQNKDGSYTPEGLNDKPGGRYNQHTGMGTPWGEGEEDYSGHSARVGYDYSDQDKYKVDVSNAEMDAVKRTVKTAAKHTIRTGLVIGTAVGGKFAYDTVDKLSDGHAKEFFTKDVPEILRTANYQGVARILTQTVAPKVADKINDLIGDAERAANMDAEFQTADPANPRHLFRGQPIQPGTEMWRTAEYSPDSIGSLNRKAYMVWDERSADFYAAFGNGLAKSNDTENHPIIAYHGTATRKLYIADINTVIDDVIRSYTKEGTRVGTIDRLAFDRTGQVTPITRWVCRYLLGGQEDVQKRWVGNHGQVIDYYAKAGYDGMMDLTDYFGGMASTPCIMFGAEVPGKDYERVTDPSQTYGIWEATDKKVSQGVWEGTVKMIKLMTGQKLYANKTHVADYILNKTNSRDVSSVDVAEARKAKPIGNKAAAPYDLQELERNTALKFPSMTEAATKFVTSRGDAISKTDTDHIYKFSTSTKPSSSASTRKENSAKVETSLGTAIRTMMNYKYSGKTKTNYDAERFLIRQCGAMQYYKLAGMGDVKASTYDSLRQQAIDYISEHPDSDYDVHELMGIIYGWGGGGK